MLLFFFPRWWNRSWNVNSFTHSLFHLFIYSLTHHSMKKYWVFLLLLLLFFGLCCAACRILVPWPGIEPSAPAMEAQSPNHRTTREFPIKKYLLSTYYITGWWSSALNPSLSDSVVDEFLRWPPRFLTLLSYILWIIPSTMNIKDLTQELGYVTWHSWL